jgi:hypothetical protein
LFPFLKDFHSFFYFPYTTTGIFPVILWFPLVCLVPSLCLGNSCTFFSHPSPSSCPSPSNPALQVVYHDPSFGHPSNQDASLQQVRPIRHPQISTMPSRSNTQVPLSNDGLCYSISELASLNDHTVTDLSHIHTTSIQELHQALGQSVVLVQYLLGNPRLTATVKVVDCNHLRQQQDQNRIT